MENILYDLSTYFYRQISLPALVRLCRLGFTMSLVFITFSGLNLKADIQSSADGLVIAANGKSDYQIVIPDESAGSKVGEWISKSASLLQEAFRANGFILNIVVESKADAAKSGIYLGDTKFARNNGVILAAFSDWGYIHKVIGKNVIIAGIDKSAPDDKADKTEMSFGTVKGVCDFLRKYVGTRFLYPGTTGIEFLQTAVVSVPTDLNEVMTPLLKFNYCLNWTTGFYEIANNMFPTRSLSEKTINQVSVKSPGLFEDGKFYKVVNDNIAYTYNWGSFHPVAYTPKKTPRYVGAQVKNILNDSRITGIVKDGFGECFGLEGPVYYVSGRLLDDGKALHASVVHNLLNEFYKAAFGEASIPMQIFYNELYHGLELYSEWFGVGGSAEYQHTRGGDKPRYIEDPLHFISYIYSPQLILKLESELEKAMDLAVSPKVKQRLALISIEFNYLKSMVKVVHLYNSYKIEPDDASWKSLLDAVDSWNTLVNSYYDPDGKIKTLSGWPELVPFNGDPRSKLGLKQDEYLAKFSNTPFAWDTKKVTPVRP